MYDEWFGTAVRLMDRHLDVPESRDERELANRLGELLAGRYDIGGLVGRGGMALVYRAHDVRHDRLVAIKVLRPELATELGGERFLREIQTTARLQHPHILTLIDSGASGDLLYYVMPFIDGRSLREKITAEKQLSLEDTVRIATDVASAIGYAHQQGVIHRDIKPENVLLHQGEALVSDFGIAFAARSAHGERLTETGLSIGTPTYMSPEQATGDRALDERSDQYSLACVVYEMLTGEPPFKGATAGATMSKMMTGRLTPISVIRDNVPAHVDAAVTRALSKVPGDRFPTVERFARALADPQDITTAPSLRSIVPDRRTIKRLAASVAAVVVLVAVVAMFVTARSAGTSDDPITRQLTFTGDAESVALSPDGSFIAYLTNGRRRLNVRDIDGESQLTVYESGLALGPPQWSPDGLRIVFTAMEGNDRRLLTVPRLGGTATQVMSGLREIGLSANYAFSSDNGFVISCCRGKIYVGTDPASVVGRVQATDSDVVGTLIDVRSVADFVPEVAQSPNGRFVAFIGGFPNERLVVGLVPSEGGEPVILDSREGSWFEGGRPAFYSLRWAANNRIDYAEHAGSGSRVVSIPLDRRGNVIGEKRVAFVNLPTGTGFDVAPNRGRLVYAGGVNRSGLELVERGVPGSRRISSGTYTFEKPALSPDGQRLAFLRGADAQAQLVVMDLPDGEPGVMASDLRVSGIAGWSPDGGRLAIIAETPGGGGSVHIVDVGTGHSRLVAVDLEPRDSPQWSDDGSSLVFWRGGPQMMTLNLDDDAIPLSIGNMLGPDEGQPADRLNPPARGDSDDVDVDPLLRPGAGGPGFRGRRFVVSPTGQAFAAYTRAAAEGQGALALFSNTGMRRMIVEDLAVPLAWGTADRIYFVDDGVEGGGATHIDAVSAAGGEPVTWLRLPFRCPFVSLTISADGQRAVCAVRETITDVWLVDGLPSIGR